jgi:ribosomal protein L12E/L44/L45/RPP1/RPP2
MPDKIRIVGSFGDDVVEQVKSFVEGLQGVTTVQVLMDGVDKFPHPDEEAAAAAHAPAEQGGPAQETTAAPAEGEGEPAPPSETGTESERRVGPADRREAPASA